MLRYPVSGPGSGEGVRNYKNLSLWKNRCPSSSIIHEEYNSYVNVFEPPENSYFVIVTHGHEFDLDIAKAIISRGLKYKYLGIIASRKKAEIIRKALKENIGGSIDLSRLFSPIGLKIGGDSAGEIALSIAAELIQVKYSI